MLCVIMIIGDNMKKNILFMILGMVIMAVISVGVYAINASQITYNDTTVEGAINDLYTEANKDILTRLNLSSSKVNYSESQGMRIPNRTTSLNLTAGSYLVVVSYHFTGGITGTDSVSNNSTLVSLNYNNGNCTRLSGRRANTYISPGGYATANVDLSDNNILASYVCKFDNDLVLEVNSNDNVSENAYHESHIMAQAIKLD